MSSFDQSRGTRFGAGAAGLATSPSAGSSSAVPWPGQDDAWAPSRTSLIPEDQVPSSYVSAWTSTSVNGTTVSLARLQRLLSAGNVKASIVERITSTVVEGENVRKQDFFVALALLALAQNDQEPTLEAVTAAVRSGNVPAPTLSSSAFANEGATGSSGTTNGRVMQSPRVTRMSSDVADPWSSVRQTGGASTSAADLTSSAPAYSVIPDADESMAPFGGDFANGSNFYGSEGWELGPQEGVEVMPAEHLGGWLLKHKLWIVRNEKTGLYVERRYSDFVWLLDALTRRYPFRMLPSLPPKRLTVGGKYLAADVQFLDRRRRGLQRFMNFVVNHPVLKRDGIVHVFRNEQVDLTTWRKSTPISLEEIVNSSLTPRELSMVPEDLESKLTQVRSRINQLVEHWTRIAITFGRIVERREAEAADWTRLKLSMDAAIETERNGWRTQEVLNVEADEEIVAEHAGKAGEILDSSVVASADAMLEQLKRHRELYAYFRDLLGRQITLGPDSVDKLRKRTEVNMRKSEQVRAEQKPGYEVELDRLASTIEGDQKTVEQLLKRRVFIRLCMWEELIYLFRSTSLLSRAVRSYAGDERRFVERLLGNWQSMYEALEVPR